MIEISEANWKRQKAELLRIREAVFVQEQGVNLEEELDEKDEDATHFLALEKDSPVATARVICSITSEEPAQIGRMAVLASHRKLGIGSRLLSHIENWIYTNTSAVSISLHAQTHALNFYKKQGFHQVGDFFIEADIEHQKMEKMIQRPTHE